MQAGPGSAQTAAVASQTRYRLASLDTFNLQHPRQVGSFEQDVKVLVEAQKAQGQLARKLNQLHPAGPRLCLKGQHVRQKWRAIAGDIFGMSTSSP